MMDVLLGEGIGISRIRGKRDLEGKLDTQVSSGEYWEAGEGLY
jgi:hypothetical protein